uniref:Putative homeobox transcription factor sip1 n=1 Tax=Ixodes ricinus TaxID=34613 RepID=A0A6B0UDW8_IXORI
MPGQLGITSKGLRTQFALKQLIAFVLLSVAWHFGPRVRGHKKMLALGLSITMGNQVVHDPMLISGDIGAGTATKPDVLSRFQWAAGLSQKCSSPSKT